MPRMVSAEFLASLKQAPKTRNGAALGSQQNFMAAATEALQSQSLTRKTTGLANGVLPANFAGIVPPALSHLFTRPAPSAPMRAAGFTPADDVNSGPRILPGAPEGDAVRTFKQWANFQSSLISSKKDNQWFIGRGTPHYTETREQWQKGIDSMPATLEGWYIAARKNNIATGRSNVEIDTMYANAKKEYDDFKADVAAGKDFGEPWMVQQLRRDHNLKGEPRAFDPSWIPPEIYKERYSNTATGVVEWRDPVKKTA